MTGVVFVHPGLELLKSSLSELPTAEIDLSGPGSYPSSREIACSCKFVQNLGMKSWLVMYWLIDTFSQVAGVN